MKPDLDQYLARIGFEGEPRVDLETLRKVHRGHAISIPYENLDVYVLRPVDRDIERIFTKIVREGRGGWCYEMNGLLGWALREIGFDVTPHAGGVYREVEDEILYGGHLIHTVALDGETWVTDVGLGDAPRMPLSLCEENQEQDGRHYRFERTSDGAWRFCNDEKSWPPGFVFRFEPADGAVLDTVGQWLQTEETSLFRQNLICRQMSSTGAKALVGRTFSDTDKGIERHLLGSESEMIDLLAEEFGLTPPPLGDAWERVVARHEELFGEDD